MNTLGTKKQVKKIKSIGVKADSNQIGVKPVFDSNAQLGLLFANESYQPEDERQKELEGYLYDENLSSKREAVYHNPKINETYISQRGTKPSDLNDLWQDAQIVTGLFGQGTGYYNSDRVYKGEKTIQKVKDKYNDSHLKLTGHSLGAATSYELGKKYNLDTYNFNRGVGLAAPFQDRKCGKPNQPEWCEKIRNFRINYDPLSFLGKYQYNTSNIENSKIGILEKHKLSSFFN